MYIFLIVYAVVKWSSKEDTTDDPMAGLISHFS